MNATSYVRHSWNLLAVALAVSASLSVTSLLWAVPTAVAAFLTGRGPGRGRPMACALVAVLALGAVAVVLQPAWLTQGSRFVAVMVCAGMLPWFAGRFWRQYQDLVRAGWERAAFLEREQQLIAEQARSRERARIAQDMHDVLGHELSLIALLAGALKLTPGLDEEPRALASDIRAKAASSVDRLGSVIGVLRAEQGDLPQPSNEKTIATLVSNAQAAGLMVAMRIEGEAEPSQVAERAAQRVVQEALTNVAKHAPQAEVTVQVSHTASHTDLTVRNTPAPARGGTRCGSGGHGLIGLEERVRLAGGSFAYGHEDDDGFTVAARVPHRAGHIAAPEAGRLVGALPAEHRRARRRVGQTLLAGVALPLVIVAALVGWQELAASRSVLDPADYARLRVGQERAEVEKYLPDRQAAHRPTVGVPKESDITCEFYAMTADRLSDRSGDVYRLCFQRGTLVSRDALIGG